MDRLLRAVSTKTAKTTAIYYVSNFGLNVLRYFFHLILMKFFAPNIYGEFLSYLSLQYLLGIPLGTIGTIVTKTVSDYHGKKDDHSINAFFYYILRITIPLAATIGAVLILFASSLAGLFKASPAAFIVLGISMVVSLFSTVVASYVSAFQKFIFQTVVGFIGLISSLVLAIVFIRLGFGATGAVIAQMLSSVLVVLITLLNIKPFIFPVFTKIKKLSLDLKSLTGYSLFYTIGTLSLVSTDILTVRFLLSPTESGLYSALSIMGRMILFGLTPIIGLVLPIASHRHFSQGSAKTVFFKLGAVITLFGLIGSLLFSLAPTFFIKTLSGSAYIPAAPFLPLFAFSMFFFALSQFIVTYLLAVGRPKATLLLIIASLSQPLSFFLFGVSLSHIIVVNFAIHSILLLSLIFTYLHFQRTD